MQSGTEESGGKGYQVGYCLNEISCEGFLGHENHVKTLQRGQDRAM